MENTFDEEDDRQNLSTKEDPPASEQSNDDMTENSFPNAILELLDDKNKSISMLQRQIHNQKLQLAFYLHRGLHNPKIVDLSNDCVPCEAEENLHINLAMNKFCKHSGLKSHIFRLHERMINVEKRILRLIEEQGEIVGLISDKLEEAGDRCPNQRNAPDKLSEIELLVQLLEFTDRLRNELDAFRNCCNQLIIIEDERNSLVEQVYSMPEGQRVNYGVLLAAQYEKLRLEKEVSDIKREQKNIEERISALHKSGTIPENDSSVLAIQNDQSNINKMLESIDIEAVSLLTMTKNQKQKYMEEMAKLKDMNCVLAAQVTGLQKDVQFKQLIENKMDEIINEYEKFKVNSSHQLGEMHVKLGGLIDENEQLNRELNEYRNIDEQVKILRLQIEDVNAIRKQRDYYKSQVGNLQAIRSTYAQLVEQPLSALREEESKRNIEALKIKELQKQRDEMLGSIRTLNETIVKQDGDIKSLLLAVEIMKQQAKDKKQRHIAGQQVVNERTDTLKDSGYNSENIGAYSKKLEKMQTVFKELHEQNANTAKTNKNEQPKRPVDNVVNVKTVLSSTSIQVQSVNRQGVSDSLKAVLESSCPIDGLIQLMNSSALTIRLSNGPKYKQNQTFKNSFCGKPNNPSRDDRDSTSKTTNADMSHQNHPPDHLTDLYDKEEQLKHEDEQACFDYSTISPDNDSDSISDESNNETIPEQGMAKCLKEITTYVDQTLEGTNSMIDFARDVYGYFKKRHDFYESYKW